MDSYSIWWKCRYARACRCVHMYDIFN